MKANLLGILKLICFLLLLPLIYCVCFSFSTQVMAIGQPKSLWLCYGAGIFIACYLFVYNFQEVYALGQRMVAQLLAFAKPVADAASVILPIYTILLSVAFLILNNMKLLGNFEEAAVMALSFSWMMHVVLTAFQLNDGEKAVIKGGYFLSFGASLVVCVLIAALLLALLFPEFSIGHFIQHLSNHTTSLYHSIYKTLFVPPV